MSAVTVTSVTKHYGVTQALAGVDIAFRRGAITAVVSVVLTVMQERGPQAKPVEAKRDELAATPRAILLDAEELAEIERIGENAGCMALKGGSALHDGADAADQWSLDDDLRAIAERWGIVPERDLVLRT